MCFSEKFVEKNIALGGGNPFNLSSEDAAYV